MAIAAMGLSPSACKCEVVAIEMTTNASLGSSARIHPSSTSIDLDLTSPSARTYATLPRVLFTRVVADDRTKGSIDLDFKLILASETVSRTAVAQYRTYSLVGQPGAPGATASLSSNTPIVFSSEAGTLTIDYLRASSNLLGQTFGASSYTPLTIGVLFTPIPEPSSCVILLSSATMLYCRRRRLRWLRRRSFPI